MLGLPRGHMSVFVSCHLRRVSTTSRLMGSLFLILGEFVENSRHPGTTDPRGGNKAGPPD